jgi:hypothetical protein
MLQMTYQNVSIIKKPATSLRNIKSFETSKGAAKGSKTTSKKDLKQVTTFFLHGGGGPNLLCG